MKLNNKLLKIIDNNIQGFLLFCYDRFMKEFQCYLDKRHLLHGCSISRVETTNFLHSLINKEENYFVFSFVYYDYDSEYPDEFIDMKIPIEYFLTKDVCWECSNIVCNHSDKEIEDDELGLYDLEYSLELKDNELYMNSL